jgi:hypothetical protein
MITQVASVPAGEWCPALCRHLLVATMGRDGSTEQDHADWADACLIGEGHEDRKGLFSSRPLRPSVQSERKAGTRIYSLITPSLDGRVDLLDS